MSVNAIYSYCDDIFIINTGTIDVDRIRQIFKEYQFQLNDDKTVYMKNPVEFVRFI